MSTFIRKGPVFLLTVFLLVFAGRASAGPNAGATLSLDLIANGGPGNRIDDGVTSGRVSGQGTTIAIEVFAKGVATPLRAVTVQFDYDDVLRFVKIENAPAFTSLAPTELVALSPVTLSSSGFLFRAEFVTVADVTGQEFSIGIRRVELAESATSRDVLTTDAVISFTPASLCPGDFDADGMVNLTDFLLFADVYGTRSSDASYNARMDMDGSGRVDLSDFLAFAPLFGTTCPTPAPLPVSIPDDNLRAVIADSLGKAHDAEITRAEMATLTRLEAPNSDISDLTGLEHAVNMTRLNLGSEYVEQRWVNSNDISELSPLSSLTRMVHLDLAYNSISDVSALFSLSNLQWLSLHNNQLSGAIPRELGSLSKLQWLSLSENQLSGAIPVALGSLSKLERLYLHNNQLSGEIPAALGSLSKLERLYLHNNQLSGEIPAALGSLSKLERLLLSENQLSGSIPVALGSLSNLRYLYLHNNQLSGSIPVALGSLSNLERLYLHNNQLSGAIPRELGSLSNLKVLSLSENQLSGAIPRELGSLSKLQWLSLRNNQLSGAIPRELGSLSKLERLYLNGNAGLSDAMPGSFTGLDSLAYLYVDGTELCASTDAAFQTWLRGIEEKSGVDNCRSDGSVSGDRAALVALYNATNGSGWTNKTNWLSNRPLGEWYGVTTDARGRVTELELGGNKLTGSVPPELGNMANLRTIGFSLNQLSGSLPPGLGSLSRLEQLYLNGNQLTGSIPSQLGNLSNLQRMLLNGNRLSGAIPSELGSLANLRDLWLQENELSGTIPTELARLSNLENLYLNGNKLSGSIPSVLGRLSRLESLHLDTNELSGSVPSELGSLSNLQNLNLHDNRLSGSIPPELGSLAKLRRLNLHNNRFSGALPGELTGLRSLIHLNLSGTQLCAPIDDAFQAWLRGIANKYGVVDCGEPITDYDSDDDGLIEVSNLAQLNAIRWDLDGDGAADNSADDYEAAFPGAAAGMGCPEGGCTGYELVADLDFDTNDSGGPDEGDDYWNDGQGWVSIGGGVTLPPGGGYRSDKFNATLEGNSHIISGLYVNRPEESFVGLFGDVADSTEIRNVGIDDAYVTGDSWVGGLVGFNRGGTIIASYTTGSVTGVGHIGGLVGGNRGTIAVSFAKGSVSNVKSNNVGGLAGYNGGVISTSYATGSVTSNGGNAVGGLVGYNSGQIITSYAIGRVTAMNNIYDDIGGLLGGNGDDGVITASYWDTETSGQPTSAGGEGKTTSELQSPMSNTGIYADWNPAVWDFGTSSQYPALKNLGLSPAEQRRSHPTSTLVFDTAFTAPTRSEKVVVNGVEIEAAENEILVFLDEDVSSEEVRDTRAEIQAQGGRVKSLNFDLRTIQVGITDDIVEQDFINELSRQSGVSGANVNEVVTPDQSFITSNEQGRGNAPYSRKPGFLEVPPPSPVSFAGDYWIDQIDATRAWEALSGPGVTLAPNKIGIVDTGVPSSQDVLSSSRISRYTEEGVALSGDDTSRPHGYNVTGYAAGYGNGPDRRGVNPHSDVVFVDVYRDEDGDGESKAYVTNLLLGIQTAIDKGAGVVNISWGDGTRCNDPASERQSSRQRWRMNKTGAVHYARQRDVLLVWSAGNNCEKNDDRLLPLKNGVVDVANTDSWLSHTLIVGASTDSLMDACFSRMGAVVNVMAPGVSVGFGDETGNGTSYAAPMVTGAAGLVRSIESTISAEETRSILVNSARNAITFDTGCGEPEASSPAGLLNLGSAIQSSLVAYGIGLNITGDVHLARGQMTSVNINVTVPAGGVHAIDVGFVIDQSSSYDDDIATLQTRAADIVNSLRSRTDVDVQFGVVGFADFPQDPYGGTGDVPYRLYQSITDDTDALIAAINKLNKPLMWGGDDPESQYEALFRTAREIGWRDGALRILLLATDNDFHDSDTESGYPGIGRFATVATLQAENIIVIGLQSGGSSAAARRLQELATTTGGSVLSLDAASTQIVEAIERGLEDALARVDVTLDVLAGQSWVADIAPLAHEGVQPGETVGFTVSLVGQRDPSIEDLPYNVYLWARGDGSALLSRTKIPIIVPKE